MSKVVDQASNRAQIDLPETDDNAKVFGGAKVPVISFNGKSTTCFKWNSRCASAS